MGKIFKPKTKKIKHVECGGFIVDFYANERVASENYARISTVSRNFEMKVCGHPFGYLLASAEQGKVGNIHGFCAMHYLIADGVFQDETFAGDLSKAVIDYQTRLLAEAEEAAKNVTPESEAADQAFMEDIASEQNLGKDELRAKREADKEVMRDILQGKEVEE